MVTRKTTDRATKAGIRVDDLNYIALRFYDVEQLFYFNWIIFNAWRIDATQFALLCSPFFSKKKQTEKKKP